MGGLRVKPTAYNVFKTGDAYNAIIAGVWSYVLNASQFLNGYFYNSSQALNDEIEYKFSHKQGPFNLMLLCVTDAWGGITTVYLDGVAQGTFDLYTGVTVWNVRVVVPITILRDGEHTLRLRLTGQTPPSAAWRLNLSSLWITD